MSHPLSRPASLLLLCRALSGWAEEPASAPAPGDSAALLAAAEAALAEGEVETAMEGFRASAEAAFALSPRRVPRAALQACLHLSSAHGKLRQTGAAVYWAGRVPPLDPHNLHQLWDDALLQLREIAQSALNASHDAGVPFFQNSYLVDEVLEHVGGYPYRQFTGNQTMAGRTVPPVLNASPFSLAPLGTSTRRGYDPNKPAVARAPELEEAVKTAVWGHLATAPVETEVWGFHAGEARVTALASSGGKTRAFTHKAPFTDIQASQTFSNEIWLASASQPLLARLDAAGGLLGTHVLRRPATSFAVRTSTRHVFYAGEGRLWRLDLETGENRNLGLAAQRVAMHATETALFVAAAGLNERDRTCHPVLRATLRDSVYLHQGAPFRGSYLLSCSVSPWGEVWPCAVSPGGDARIVNLEAGWGALHVYLTTWQGFHAPDSLPQGMGRFSSFLQEQILSGASNDPGKFQGLNQAMLGVWCSPRHETRAVVFPGGLAFQHCHEGASVAPDSMKGALTLLPNAAWSGDGRLFVCAARAAPDGPEGGVMAVAYKPSGLDDIYWKVRTEARARRAPVDERLLASRREEWAARLEAPRGHTPGLPAATDARAALLATHRLPLPVARPSWADTPAAAALDPALRAELDRLLDPEDSPEDPGPLLARAFRAAAAAGPHPAGALAVARAQVRSGMHAPALAALDELLKADAGRTDITHLALEAMAEARAATGRAPEALAALAASLTLDPLRQASLAASARLGVEPRPAPGIGRGPPVELPVAPAAPALAKDKLTPLLESSFGLARLDGQGERWEAMPALLLDDDGLVLTRQPRLSGHNESVEVRILGSGEEKPIPARIVRVDEATGLILVRLTAKPPAPVRPAAFAATGPREGEDVFLPQVREQRNRTVTLEVQRGLAGKPAGTLLGLPVFTHSATGEDPTYPAPLLNAAGQVVGVSIGLPGQDLSGVAVPVEALRAWLREGDAP